MTRPKSLTNIFWMSMASLYLMLVCSLIYLWVGQELKNAQSQIDTMRKTYIHSQKKILKTQVKQAIDYIRYKKSLAEKRVKLEVKSRTNEACKTALYIYKQNRKERTLDQIKKLVHDALYAVSWDDGKGYYFAQDMVGTELVNRNNPELEGQNILDIQDSKGTYIVKQIIAVAQSPEQEGFCSYYWNKPEYPGVLVPKISYVKYFEPLDWVIGNGKYLVDEEQTIQKEVIARIEQIKYGAEGYVFAGTWDGLSLSGPFTGENMRHITDPNGVKIVQELIEVAKSGGGFVEYVVPKFKGQAPVPKISYAEPVREWKWYIGTGLHIDAIEAVILQKQKQMKDVIRTLILKCVAVLCLFWVISFMMVWLLSKKIKKNLDLFAEFFKRSANQALPIESDKVSFTEFQSLAVSANQMSRERQKSEKALRDSEQQLSIHLQNTPVGAISWDLDAITTEWNPAAEEIFGYTRQEAIGKHMSELIIPDEVEELTSTVFKALLSNRGGEQSINENITKTGERILCEWYNTTLKNVDGNVTGVASLVNNITDRKRTEELMIQTEKMMSVGGLAAGMAHEINNPLAGMMQTANVLSNRLTDNKMPANIRTAEEIGINMGDIKIFMEKRDVPRMITAINESGHRVAEIVDNMLSFARKSDVQAHSHSMAELLDKTLELAATDFDLKKRYDFKMIEIRKEYEKKVPFVRCDGTKIQQVLLNVFKNGAQAMQETGIENPLFIIRIRFEKDRKMVCVEIKDNGPGMDEKIRKRVFEPFFTTKPVGVGTGLGLSVSYFIIADNHGGEMTVESTPGFGTKFIIRLPLKGRV